MLDTRLERLILGMMGIVLMGTIGFVVLEGVSWFDALYMTTITLATVGFSEVWELSALGRIWTIVIMFSGIGIFFMIVGSIAQRAVDFQRYRRFRMANQVKKLHDHFILCGYGRMGQSIAKELTAAGKKFVVIEKDPDKVANMVQEDMIFIDGDATDDDILAQAGVEKAKTLISVLKDDQDNLFLKIWCLINTY